MDEQKKMRWLHISDLHFGYKSNNIVQMLEELIRQKPCFDHVDCLFLTGDFRYAKEYKDDYPDDAAYYLRSIQEKFGVRGDHVFLVPGNHDVNRIGNVLERDVDDMLKEYQARGCTIDDSPEMTTYMKRIRDHRAAFHKFYKDIKGIDAPEEWHYCVELDDFPFNIVCLDTTLACGRDNEDGSLIIGQNLLNDLAKDPRCHWERPSIVLAHHNFGSLNEKERDHLEIVLKRKMNAILYLCGHSHSVKTEDYKGRESKPLRIFIGGTGMDHTPDSWSDMDVLFGEIDPQNLKGWVKAYRWDPRYEKWISDTGFSCLYNEEDAKSFFPSRPTRMTTKGKSVETAYREELRRRCDALPWNGLRGSDTGHTLNEIYIQRRLQRTDWQTVKHPHRPPSGFGEQARTEKMSVCSTEELFHGAEPVRAFLFSERGDGKSTLLKWIAAVCAFSGDGRYAALSTAGDSVFPFWIPFSANSERDIFETPSLTDYVAKQIAALLPGHSEQIIQMLISEHLQDKAERIVFLFDDLDRVRSKEAQRIFLRRLSDFVRSSPRCHVLISLRPDGMLWEENDISAFAFFRIMLLEDGDMKAFCKKWVKTYGDGSEAELEREADGLSKRIIHENTALYSLARHPLMLSELLLAQKRYGRWPAQRSDLYEDVVNIFLNEESAAHGASQWTLGETRRLLSNIAFLRITQENSPAFSQSHLKELCREVCNQREDLFSSQKDVETFLESMLKSGVIFVQDRSQGTELTYRFREEAFQEYLAAVAVDKGWHSDYNEEKLPGEILLKYLSREHLSESQFMEMMILSAMMNLQCGRLLSKRLCKKLDDSSLMSDDRTYFRNLVLRFLAEGVLLPDEVSKKILFQCFTDGIRTDDTGLIYHILRGKYKDALWARFQKMGEEQHQDRSYWDSFLEMLDGTIKNPFQYYREHTRPGCTHQEQVKAVSVLSDAFWFPDVYVSELSLDPRREMQSWSSDEWTILTKELLQFANSDWIDMQWQALRALHQLNFSQDCEYADYLNACVKYMNRARKLPMVWFPALCKLFKRSSGLKISEALDDVALEATCAAIRQQTLADIPDYERCLSLVLLVVLCHTDVRQISLVLEVVSEKREEFLTKNPLDYRDCIHCTRKLSLTLQKRDSTYSEKEADVLITYIKKADLSACKILRENGEKVSKHLLAHNFSDWENEPDKVIEPDEVIEWLTKCETA